MTEYDKNVKGFKEAKEDDEAKVKDYEKNSKDQNDWKTKFEKLDAKVKQQEANKKAQEDSKLTKRIEGAFGDSKFINEYTKKSLINEMKSAIKNPENEDK